jgi:zinc carboxypeptidase
MAVCVSWFLIASTGPATANPALDGYANYVSLTEQVRKLDESDLVALRSLGKSLDGRDVWLIVVGSGKVDEKPAIVVVGNVDPAHIFGSELALRAAQKLVAKAGQDEATKKLLAERTFYFIPRPDPDGTEKCFRGPFREPAGNARKTDDDRDFSFGEDGPDDLNGDGWITQMRIEDETGKLFPHPQEPRILVTADPKKGERGRYRVLTEGRDNDGDEQFNEDAGDGVALSRNFTFGYRPFTAAAGANAASESESRLLADFLHDRPNVAVVFSFSTEDNLFHPWKPDSQKERGRIKTAVLSSDAALLEHLAAEYKKVHGGSDCPAPPEPAGSFSQWAYFHYGRWSLSARAWWVPKTEPPKKDEPDVAKEIPADDKRGSDERNVLNWLAKEKLDGFADWKPIEHPDFPGKKVEVGGLRPFYQLNPPAKELDALADKHIQFLTMIPTWLPELAIVDRKAEALGGGVQRISLTIVNRGLLPTMPEMGQVNGEFFPLQVELSLPKDAVLLQGHARSQLPRIEGSGGKAERTWLVRFPGEVPAKIDVKVFAPAVGSATAEIALK